MENDLLKVLNLIDQTLPAILTCIIVYSSIKFLIKVWQRWRFNQKEMAYNYGYSNSENNGPKYWKIAYPCCAGENQSPINIDTCMATCVYACNPLKWTNFVKKAQNMIMINTGTNVALVGCECCNEELCISGGPLEQRSYDLTEINFRWGKRNDLGSEHTVDYVRYPLEIQLRFSVNSNDNVFNDVFIALFCKISSEDNPNFNGLVNSLNKIILPGTSTEISFSYEWLQLPFSYGYYTYPGSLTFPPCCENVTWIVYPQPINISSAQVGKFRELRNFRGRRIKKNARPVQSVNSRTVLFYDE